MTVRPTDLRDVAVIAPNFKRRLSGVTSTIVQLVPEQQARGVRIAVLGPGLPAHLPHIRFRELWRLWWRPAGGGYRVWHARRNTEMIGGLILRDLLRMPVKLLFTSAAQRDHTPFTKWLIARMDRVVATSHRSGRFLAVPHDIVMHGVETERFRPSARRITTPGMERFEGSRLAGCFGRVRHQKGTDLFVDAMIALLPLHPQWQAVIAGRVTAEHAAFETSLKTRIAAAGLEQRIVFLGEVDDITPWFQHIDLYVAPSRNEGFGLTPLEAMASGTPVVASDAGAYAEMIDPSISGRVVPAGDGAALTSEIAGYMEDEERRRTEADAAVSHVRTRFPLEREAEMLNDIYRSMMGDGDAG